MHAENALGPPLAIFAGAGRLPRILADAARHERRTVLALRIDGEADDPFDDVDSDTIRYGELGRILRLLRERDIREIVFAGRVNRPSLGGIRPDWGGVRLMPRLARILTGGDDALLRGVADMLADEGLTLLSPLDVARTLSAGPGSLAGLDPGGHHLRDVAVGLNAARTIGGLDAGQAVIVSGGRAIALEGLEGTDAMIERAAALRASGRWRSTAPSGILVKTAKPQQDMRLDVPTIGPSTIENAAEAGLAGIAFEARRVLLIDRGEIVRDAEEKGVFVWGAA